MIYYLYIITACVQFLKKKSHVIFIFSIVFLWVLMAFTYGNADESIYISRYTDWKSWTENTEPLYNLLMVGFNTLGASFQTYKAIITAIQLILISSTILKYSKYPNLVILLYSVFPFAIDVAQMRNALSASIVIFSVRFLIDQDRRKTGKLLSKNDLYFIFCVFVATMVHAASLIYISLLLVKKLNMKHLIITVAIFDAFFAVFLKPSAIFWIASKLNVLSRIGAYASDAYISTNDYYFYNTMIRTIIAFILIIIVIYVAKKMKNVQLTEKQGLEFVEKCNVAILVILPIMTYYTIEVYRMQVALSIVNYIFLTNCLNNSSIPIKITKKNIVIISLLILMCSINLYLLIIRGNYETVLKPIFDNNYIFDLMY